MNKLLRRLAPALVLGLPLFASAQGGRPDPADARTPGAPLRYASVFADYKPWQDDKPGDWRALNDGLRAEGKGGSGHAGHAGATAGPAAAPAPGASRPTESHKGGHAHHHHGGKP